MIITSRILTPFVVFKTTKIIIFSPGQEAQPPLFQELQGAKMSVSEGCQQAHSQNSAKIVVVQSVLVVYKSNDKIFKWKEDLCRFLKDITFAIQFPHKYSKKKLNVDFVS